MKLTPKERKILGIAQFKANAPLHELARQAGVREHTVRHCLDSLLSRKVIEPFTLINIAALGFTEYAMFFSFAPISLERQKAVLKAMTQSERVTWVGRLSGEFQYAVIVAVKTLDEAAQFFEELVDKFGEFLGHKAFSGRNKWTFYPRKHLVDIQGKQPSMHIERPATIARYDELDHQILRDLSANPGRSRNAAAKKLGIPVSTLQYRVDRLVDQKVITGFIYSLTLTEVGTVIYRLHVEVQGKGRKLRERLQSFCESHPHIVGLSDCTGSWDFEIRVELYKPHDVISFTEEVYAFLGTSLNSVRVLSSIDNLKWSMYPFNRFPE